MEIPAQTEQIIPPVAVTAPRVDPRETIKRVVLFAIMAVLAFGVVFSDSRLDDGVRPQPLAVPRP